MPRSNFTREDGTPPNYTLVNQLRINTDYSHYR